MPADASTTIADLLQRSSLGDAEALQALYARLYPEIKRVARARLAQCGGVPSLDTTGLVHEGFLRIARQQGLEGASRVQFFAYIGRVLRSVVIDQLRSEHRDKRGGAAVWVSLSAAEGVAAPGGQAEDLVAIDRGLDRLRQLDGALHELIELHAFAGLALEEVAQLRGVSLRTVNRDLLKARSLLQELLAPGH